MASRQVDCELRMTHGKTRQPMTAVTRFVILAQARTGSNLLCGLLNSHPAVLCHHGLFNCAGVHYAIDCRDGSLDFGTMADRDSDPAQFLNRVWAADLGNQAVGFKINRAENERASALVLPDAGILKIILRRRNRVRTYVSALIAERSGEWESYGTAGAARTAVPVSVSPDALFRHVEMVNEFYLQTETYLKETRQDYIALDYEALTSAPVLNRVLGFLGVPASTSALSAPGFKRNPSELRTLISNFEEVSQALKGTFLEGDLSSCDLPEINKLRVPEHQLTGARSAPGSRS